MNLKVLSFQIADSIDIREFRKVFIGTVHFADSGELFYKIAENKFLYVFTYGIVSFTGYTATEMTGMLQVLKPYCRNPFEEPLSDEFDIETEAKEYNFGYNKIEIPTSGTEEFRLIMLNVSHSVALDYYNSQTTHLLEETNHHTQILARKGKIDLKGLQLKKYIGNTLSLKNKIAANLYIFDSPEETWDDENLNKLDIGLKKIFDLQGRFRHIQEALAIVKENLDLFIDFMQHRNSVKLEIVIIILILVEVINLAVEKIFS